ncbi:trimethylamine methyltransferase family protein [Desulfobacula phenolica]|uniref:Trimethylamine---corrinoid protein Co-methyltransferase n=1 Tax=Desulfobacula phenolica TaxID=90732 RepID=A0A1H2DMM9_9BACT|nr:trimethylamine methyltransferase family protein [Desulfobacula phenolica]SDT84162.1 trimethylamine---corrinoid protein Co-methyltransferase [Desulfobacula phenolica]
MNDRANELFKEGLKHEESYDFESAKKVYKELLANVKDSKTAEKTRSRMEDMDDLIAEKDIYKRIDENGKRVLTDIGINIAESQELMDILVEADAIDFESDTAVFVPLKRDFIDRCLENIPRGMPEDPGMNCFGTGATPPFLKRPGDEELRAASKDEFKRIVQVVGEHSDTAGIFSLPVAFDKSISSYEVAKLMEQGFAGLKMTTTKAMTDDEILFLKGKDHWLDGTSLITSLAPMPTMVDAFLRSARTGTNLLLLDLTIAGASGPGSPEALLTQIHAQVMFMMVLAQTVNPGVSCMHGGIPGVVETGGDLSYSSRHQPLINAAMARLNTWITKFPSAQSGGSTSISEMNETAVMESELSRNTLRKYGSHIIRHSLGAMGSLNFFSIEKFVEDCEREKRSCKIFNEAPKDKGIIPLYFPADDKTLDGIKEIAEKGNPKSAEHTLRNVESFMKWEKTINDAAIKKLYYPQLSDTVIERIRKGEMIP